MADGDITPLDSNSLGYKLALAATNQPNVPAPSITPAQAPDIQAPMPGQNAGPVPGQGQLPPREPGTSIASQQTQPSRADFFRQMLGQFFYAAGQGLAQTGHGPGSFARGLGGGLTALPQLHMMQQQQQIAAEQARGITALHQAQANRLGMVTLPDGTQISAQDFANLKGKLASTNVRQNAIDARTQQKMNDVNAALAKAERVGIWDENGNLTDSRPMTKEELTAQQSANVGKTEAGTAKTNAETAAIPQKIAMQGKKIDLDRELGFAKLATQKDIAQMRVDAGNDPNKLTIQTKNIKQLAMSLLPHIDDALTETDGIAKELGPAAGRWNDFWQGKVGTANPAFASYKDDIGFLTTGITLAHARGRMSNELFEHFQQMFDAGKQDPENMKAAIKVAGKWMKDYASLGEPGSAIPPSGSSRTAAPTGKGALSLQEAQQYLAQAGGDKNKARALAKKDGRTF
jgi:hypothetical protein